ncbi:T9SS type A sorting domain-containing protein [Flavobacterium aquiphilum]|uniref:T9SS type A sorting domain-containing protein n=1 Tax=Flavobacterium aquiphilum TaxID=3003261 RepID=UPI0024815CA3|nr:T9SS type A sorting domain-containing protein [Flavobacterium aquiphilum]
MKKTLLFLLLVSLYSQAQDKISFTYDTAGNQTQRKLCVNCPTAKSAKTEKEILALTENELEKFSPEDQFSYYPNPVKEELFLFWKESNTSILNSIQVYSITGQLLQTYVVKKKGDSSQNIPFNTYPTGTYIVQLNYSDSSKNIKILKQ